MAAPEFFDRVIEAPLPDMSGSESYRWLYDLWQRTGGFETFIVNLNGLIASVAELNTLVGSDTNTTVQVQLNNKVNTSDVGTLAEQDADNIAVTGGSLVNVTISLSTVSGILFEKIGTSNTVAKVGASLNTNPNEIATIDASEDDLLNYTLTANALGTNGDYVEVLGFGTYAANANNKRIRLYFGSEVIFDTGAIAANGGSWEIKATVMRLASADQKAIASIITSNTLVIPTAQFTDTSQDDTIAIMIKFTGEGAAANDIIQEGFNVKWFPAST